MRKILLMLFCVFFSSELFAQQIFCPTTIICQQGKCYPNNNDSLFYSPYPYQTAEQKIFTFYKAISGWDEKWVCDYYLIENGKEIYQSLFSTSWIETDLWGNTHKWTRIGTNTYKCEDKNPNSCPFQYKRS